MKAHTSAPAHPDRFSPAPPVPSARSQSTVSICSQFGISSSATPVRAAPDPRNQILPNKRSARPPLPPRSLQEFLVPATVSLSPAHSPAPWNNPSPPPPPVYSAQM